MNRSNFIDLSLALGAVILVVAPLVLVRIPEGEKGFAGADSLAQGVIAKLAPEYTPWFSSLIEPASSELEGLLFTLQAALGAGVIGFALGRFSARRRNSAACS